MYPNRTTRPLRPELPFDEIPYGYCHCGCGQKTTIAAKNHTRLGHVKGEPYRFVAGHHNRLRIYPPVVDRFWAKVNKNGPIHPVLGTACWVWTASCQDYGYGQFWTGERRTEAHRYSYELHHGAIQAGLFVCHKCDNPSCIRPDHLFLGAPKDNTRDMLAKGRHKYKPTIGEASPNAKLTELDVIRIRELAQAKTPRKQLAGMYGVSKTLIDKIISRDVWKHL